MYTLVTCIYMYDWIYEKIDELILIAQITLVRRSSLLPAASNVTLPVPDVLWASQPLHFASFVLHPKLCRHAALQPPELGGLILSNPRLELVVRVVYG